MLHFSGKKSSLLTAKMRIADMGRTTSLSHPELQPYIESFGWKDLMTYPEATFLNQLNRNKLNTSTLCP